MHPLDHIARVCHEVNRAYCQALGDNSQPSWEDAPAWQRESARMGVDLHLMGDFGPEASHISWMNQKLNDGWKYGPVKNPDAKEHPCLVPFDQLPVEQQAKDFIFRAVVHALKQQPLIAHSEMMKQSGWQPGDGAGEQTAEAGQNQPVEGDMHINVGEVDGHVVVDFGKQIVWFGMQPDDAIGLARTIHERAVEMKAAQQVLQGETPPAQH